MLIEDSLKPCVLFVSQSISHKVLIVVKADVDKYDVNFDTFSRDQNIVLVQTSFLVYSSLRVLRFPYEIQIQVPLLVFGRQSVICIVRHVIMIIPDPYYLCSPAL